MEIGKEATFNWQYIPPGGTSLFLEKWCKLDPVRKQCTTNIIMTKKAEDQIPQVSTTNVEYASRTTGQAPSTMRIRDIRLTDDGMFEFSALFQSGVQFYDRVRLMVLGK